MDTEKIAHAIVDIVDKHIDPFDEETYHVDFYHAIEEVKRLLDWQIRVDAPAS